MTKREQIEELKNILLEESNRFYGLECDEACAYCEASAVYDAGWRKESKNFIGTDEVLRSIGYRPTEEVRKETAKEIFEKIEKLTYRLLNDKDYVAGDLMCDIGELKLRYMGESDDDR